MTKLSPQAFDAAFMLKTAIEHSTEPDGSINFEAENLRIALGGQRSLYGMTPGAAALYLNALLVAWLA